MKGIFIYYKIINEEEMSGIDKKVLSQVNTFRNANLECELFIMDSNKNIFNKLLARLPFSNVYPKWKYNTTFNEVDFIYYRRPFAMTGSMRKFLKEIRYHNPNVKILLEIPTYPYDKELMLRYSDIPFILKDKYNRKRISKLIDRVVVLNNLTNLNGVPALKISNGIDLDAVTKRIPKKIDGSINLTAVSMFSNWHGYDRIIRGLDNYYKNGGARDVKFHLVGRGAEEMAYKELIEELKIHDKVIMHGFKSGDELDMIYNFTHISVDVFGMHRKNNFISNSLKSKEYLAKGLPIISGCKSELFTEHSFDYYLEFDNDDSHIDISRVVNFYDSIYFEEGSQRNVIDNIRDFAEKNCSIDAAMKDVINYIKMYKIEN